MAATALAFIYSFQITDGDECGGPKESDGSGAPRTSPRLTPDEVSLF